MKRWLLGLVAGAALLASANSMAAGIGVVDMRAIFQSSPQVKQINNDLGKKFSGQRDQIMALGKSMEDNMKKLQRDGSVMDKKTSDDLKATIMKQQDDLRTQQAQFQQNLFNAQNQAMSDFMDKVEGVVKSVADQDKLDIVLPKNAVLYAGNSKDITNEVIGKLK